MVDTSPQSTTTTSNEPVASTSMTQSPESTAVSSTEKPVRPPKAAKRPSTSASSLREDAATTSALNLTEGEPNALGSPINVGTASEGTGNNGGLEGGRLNDEVKTDNNTESNNLASTARSIEPKEDGNTATTVSTTGESNETADSKLASPTTPASASSSSPPPAATSKPTTSTTAPTTSRNAAPSTTTAAKPSTSQKPIPKKKRKGGPFAFLSACIPCISDAGHDDSHEFSKVQQPRQQQQTTTSAPTPAKKEEEKVAQPEQQQPVQSSRSSTDEKAAPPTSSNVVTSPPATVEPESAITPPHTEPLAAASPSTPIAPPPPSAAPSPQGVTLPREETEGVTSGAVVPPGQAAPLTSPPVVAPRSRRRKSGKHPHSSGTDGIITSVPEPGARQGGIVLAGGRDSDSSEDASEEDEEEDFEEEEEEEDEEQNLIARGGVGIPIGEDGLPHPLLDELSPELKGRKCLVLDLDETLVHSSFKMVHQADYVVPVEIENQFHNVYVIKRPGVDGFLKAMGEIYEVVVFTASLSKYADPVLDQLDIHRVVKHRLFRESCYNNKGNYVKDLSQLGRPMAESIIIDNSPASYVFHVNNAVPISSWFNDPHDTELTDLVPFLTDLSTVDDVRSVLDAGLYQHVAQQQQFGTTSDEVFNQI